MSAVVLDEDVVHYEVLGRGPGILFIHSWLGSWRYWIPAMQALSTRYRTYAIDLYGFGDSSKNPTKYGLDMQVNLIDRFMDRMGVGKLALVGHGLGGTVAVNFASKFADRVAKMMMINTPLTGGAIKSKFATANVGTMVGKVPGSDELIAETNKLDAAVIQSSLDYMAQANLMEVLNNCTPPTLMVNGDRDEAIDPATDQGVDGLFKANVHRIAFEGGRHFLMLDDPAKFNRLLADFLESQDLTSLELKDEWKRRMR